MGSALLNKYFQRRSRELLLRDTWILFQAKVKKKKKPKNKGKLTSKKKKNLSNKKTPQLQHYCWLVFLYRRILKFTKEQVFYSNFSTSAIPYQGGTHE